METRTITIKSFEKTSGTKKDGTKWNRISIKATDGKFYSSFKPIPENALVPGTELKLQVTQSKIKEDTYDIQKILDFTNATPKKLLAGEDHSLVSRSPLAEAESYARELMDRATKIAHESNPEWERTSEYPYLIAVLIQTMHGKISGDRISQQEADKLKVYGNKKW